jgi:hypothetical protein
VNTKFKSVPPPPFQKIPDRSGVRNTTADPNDDWIEDTTTLVILAFANQKLLFAEPHQSKYGIENIVFESAHIRAAISNYTDTGSPVSYVLVTFEATVEHKPLWFQIYLGRNERTEEESYGFRGTPEIVKHFPFDSILFYTGPIGENGLAKEISKEDATLAIERLAMLVRVLRRDVLSRSTGR